MALFPWKQKRGYHITFGYPTIHCSWLFAPYVKIYVSYRTLKWDNFMWFFIWLCKSADLKKKIYGPKSCGFRLKMPFYNLSRKAIHTLGISLGLSQYFPYDMDKIWIHFARAKTTSYSMFIAYPQNVDKIYIYICLTPPLWYGFISPDPAPAFIGSW